MAGGIMRSFLFVPEETPRRDWQHDGSVGSRSALSKRRVIVCGGGAAGFFAAIACAEASPDVEVWLLEKGPQFLSKVRISGGGRCNVTHACFDPLALAENYPRGGKALIGPFHRFQPRDTVEWFARRGVRLKTEQDGRMFPTTDSSETIVECLVNAARKARVQMWTRRSLESAVRKILGGFTTVLSTGETADCDSLILASGGCRTASAGALAESLGHRIEPPAPSLFTFHIDSPWLKDLPGLSVEDVEVSIPSTKLQERGPLLVTHWGVSGPAILKLSAWGARTLQSLGYRFILRLNWLPGCNAETTAAALHSHKNEHPAKLVVSVSIQPLPARLWEKLVAEAGIPQTTRWTVISRTQLASLVNALCRMELTVVGKSLNKDEFVTCGGVRLREVDFKTMESRICPGLHFAGELLDIDGVTGGFNFQAAWTTGWIAGRSAANGRTPESSEEVFGTR